MAKLQTALIANGETVEIFDSDADIDARIRSIQYGVGFDKFCFAITVDDSTFGGDYTYRLRFNISELVRKT